MPVLDDVVDVSSLKNTATGRSQDLTAYTGILNHVPFGKAAIIRLQGEESARTEKRRFTIAAKAMGKVTAWKRTTDGMKLILTLTDAPKETDKKESK